MTTERAAALTDTASAGVEADPDLNPSDRPETDQPGAKPPPIRRQRSQCGATETPVPRHSGSTRRIGGHSRIGAASKAWSRWRPTRPRLRPF